VNTATNTIPAAADIEALRAKFSEYDFKLIIDGSGSMAEEHKNGVSRWQYMQESTLGIARELSKIDSDGIDVCIFSGGQAKLYNNVTGDKVKEVFANHRPSGGTPMAEALQAVLDAGKKSSKKQFILVATDGLPDNKDALANVIRKQANSQQADDECTILFMQVGYDAGATKYLEELDDHLSGVKFDIVDAKTIDQVDQFPNLLTLIAHSIQD
jgi:Mg-chelatase subunit ChlD